MKTLIILLVIFSQLPSFIYGQEELPKWVPKEVISAVKEIWEHDVSISSYESIRSMFGFISKDEALSCEFKNPVRVARVDYENYHVGDNILNHIELLDAYSFVIYQGNINKGDITIEYREGSWKMRGMGGSGGKLVEDRVGNIYKKYPLSLGYKVYGSSKAYFIVREDSVIEVNKFDSSIKEFRGFEPVEHMVKEKEKIEKFKKHPDYEKLMKEMEEREKKAKQMYLEWKEKEKKRRKKIINKELQLPKLDEVRTQYIANFM